MAKQFVKENDCNSQLLNGNRLLMGSNYNIQLTNYQNIPLNYVINNNGDYFENWNFNHTYQHINQISNNFYFNNNTSQTLKTSKQRKNKK